MKMGKRKWCLLLTAFLLMGITVGLGVAALPPMTTSKISVNHAPITIDGDPSDWIGIPGAENTFNISKGEGIWTDIAQDDTSNGSCIYPNCTHHEPLIPDAAGAPWTVDPGPTEALAYTDKYVAGTEPFWYKHGGFVDLREFRVTGDNSNLYMMFRFENMGSTEIAVEWNKGPDRQQYYKFGKIFIQVYIDKDKVSGSGSTKAIYKGNFNFSDECAWEAVISVAGDPHDPDHPPEDGVIGWPRVTFADGTVSLINHTDYCYANVDIYPSAIELKVPYSIIGDPRSDSWNFVVVVGGYDEGRWRQVWGLDRLALMDFMKLFRFAGGEGEDPGSAFGMGNDPNIVDMAFTASQAEQEALLNEFQTTGQRVEIDACLEIEFDENGDVIPWVPIYSIPILLMVILYVKKRKLNRLVERQ